MRLRCARRGNRNALGTSIALAALLCAWPSKADAGCSHYVVANSLSERPAYRVRALEIEGAVDVSSEVPARRKPCSGASCSGKPAVPISMSIEVSRPVKAVVPRPTAPPDPCVKGQLLAYAERISRAVIEGPSILRPPR